MPFKARRGLSQLFSRPVDAPGQVIWHMEAIAASGHPDAPKLFGAILRASASIPLDFQPRRTSEFDPHPMNAACAIPCNLALSGCKWSKHPPDYEPHLQDGKPQA
jgi:hypothetical protein